MKRSNTWYAVTTAMLSVIHVSSALSQTCCLLPNYESTFTVPGPDQLTRFKQELAYVLNGTTVHFDTRHVMEANGTGATPSDSCYFSQSAVPQQLSLSGGDWYVSGTDAFTTNYWGYDYLGWLNVWIGSIPPPIDYYRTERPARSLAMPCNSTVVQAMLMYCDPDGDWVEYRDRNLLARWIDMTTVTNCRTDITNSACSTQSYP